MPPSNAFKTTLQAGARRRDPQPGEAPVAIPSAETPSPPPFPRRTTHNQSMPSSIQPTAHSSHQDAKSGISPPGVTAAAHDHAAAETMHDF